MANVMKIQPWEKIQEYIKVKTGKVISHSEYYRILGTIEAQALDRMKEIAQNYHALHMQKLDELETIKTEMWVQYHQKDTKPHQKVLILTKISDTLQLISQVQEISKDVQEEYITKHIKGKPEPESLIQTL